MIDSKFIIAYTNGLYSAPEESKPKYDEFRDMFSSGQIKSKEWAVSGLAPYINGYETVIIVGSWYGMLGLMLHNSKPTMKINLLDIDPRCKEFVDEIARWESNIVATTGDMYSHKYTEDVVINTSCEHISNLQEWLNLIPKGTRVLLQSNNNNKIKDHINCCTSIEDFKSKVELSEIFYSGEFIMPMYTRYMIIGTV